MAKMYQSAYWRATPDGKRNVYGRCYQQVPESQVPDDAIIAVLGMHEMAEGDDAYKQHWKEFHGIIDAGGYVRLSYNGNPIVPDVLPNKAAADKKYGTADEERGNSKSKRRELTVVNGENQLDAEFWKWNKRELLAMAAHSVEGIARIIVKRLEAAGYPVKEFYIILHDKDERIVWNYEAKSELHIPKELHVHWLARLEKPVRCEHPLDVLAKAIGIVPENLIYPKRGRYVWENPLAYLIHAKDEDKAQYDPHEVFTLLGKPYEDIYAEKKREWDVGRAKKSKDTAVHTIDWLLDRIRDGKVSQDDVHDNVELWRLYSRNAIACDKAFEVAADHRRHSELMAFERAEFSMTTIFIHGGSGNGKTATVKPILSYLNEVYGWECANGAAKNATENWNGEQVLLLDDTSAKGMTADGWKQLLDPFNASPLAERFHNRNKAKPRVLIITSTRPPLNYFAYMAVTSEESISQFLRRLGIVVEVLDYEKWDGYNYKVKCPVRVKAYEKMVWLRRPYAIGEGSVASVHLTCTYDFKTPNGLLLNGEETVFSPWGAAEQIVRIIDANNGGIVSARPDAVATFQRVWEFVAEAFDPTPMRLPADYMTMPIYKHEASLRACLDAAKRRPNTQAWPCSPQWR